MIGGSWQGNVLTSFYNGIFLLLIFILFLSHLLSLYSSTIPIELGSGSNVGRETPNFIGLEMRKRRRWDCYLYFS